MAGTKVPNTGASFSSLEETMNPRFRGVRLLDSERYKQLDRMQSYFDCTQHDSKQYDFDGRVLTSNMAGINATQPLISGEKAGWYVPLRMRRPSATYRLSRVITNSFTNMVFGEGRFPTFTVSGDDDSQDFLQTIIKVTSLPVRMIRARNLGGAMGTACMSWAYVKGKPRVQVHNAKNIYVHSWDDRDEFMPRHVTEAYLYPQDEYDQQKKKFVRKWYWYRRDWTMKVDVIFKPALYVYGEEPDWEIDTTKSVEHNDHLCHFVWVQNQPSDSEDGVADSDGLWEVFDTIDLLLSVIMRGATLNLDPTLVLKMDIDQVQRMGVKKGSDNALAVGPEGAAEYLELGGGSIEAGINLFNANRTNALEVAQCVVPDPDKIAAAGTSAVAMKLVYAPMLGMSNILREQYEGGMKRLLEPMLVVAQAASSRTVTIYDEDGTSTEAQQSIELPQKAVKTPKTDDDGNPTGEHDVEMKDRHPGESTDIDAKWPPYFKPTPADQSSTVTTLSLAVGAVAFMSVQTATEIAMESFGRDPDEEVKRFQTATALATEQTQAAFDDQEDAAGGKVEHEKQLPDGSTIKKTGEPPPPPPPPIIAGVPGKGPPGAPPKPGAPPAAGGAPAPPAPGAPAKPPPLPPKPPKK
jgi:hypothetical protein